MRMDRENKLIKLGLRIRRIREEKGLTQMTLAHITGKEHPAINRLEKGRINPSFIFLKEIADGLELDVKVFFMEDKIEDK